MFHANTQQMIDYWTARARGGLAPSRAEVDPSDFRHLIPQTFILGRDGAGLYPMRLVGGFVADLHKRDLRGVGGLSLWSPRDQLRLQATLEEIRRRPEPVVVIAEAAAEGVSLPMEVLLAPLRAHDGGPDRYLGLYQPLSMVSRLKGQAVAELSLTELHRLGANQEPANVLRLAALDGRRIA